MFLPAELEVSAIKDANFFIGNDKDGHNERNIRGREFGHVN